MKILLDYVFPISVIQPTPAASTAFLKQVCAVVKPKAGQEGEVGKVFLCTSIGQVSDLTDNEDIQQLFDAGMNRVYVLLSNDLDIAEALEENRGDFFTVLISSDFGDSDLVPTVTLPEVKAIAQAGDIAYTSKLDGALGNAITIEYLDTNTDGNATVTVTDQAIEVSIEEGVTTALAVLTAIENSEEASALVSGLIDLGQSNNHQNASGAPIAFAGGVTEVATDGLLLGGYKGVTGVASSSLDIAKAQAKIENRSVFKVYDPSSFANLFYAFGKLLSNISNWLNNQYVSMPINDLIVDLGTVNLLFDERVSFVLSDDEFGNRLGFFVAGGKAITAPYITKNLIIDMQSRALQWITANQPQYTLKEASLLETRINEDVVQNYIDRQWLESGNVSITLRDQNFVATGEIDVPEPKALWRVFGELRQTV